ncbi:MAG: hypothetical protein JRF63_15005 [Deltaproteobacteria bacterium]|nr:hypothetical protein [Deltaproteobacteria bacterium]
MEPDTLNDDEMDRLLAASLSVEDPDSEQRALAASVRAINHIEPLRREARAPARRRNKVRILVLLVGWLGAGIVALLAGEIADLLARVSVEQSVASPFLTHAAAWFSVPPIVFAVGIVLLLVVSAVSLRLAFADD